MNLVLFLVSMIEDMDTKDKLRLSINISKSSFLSIQYDKKEIYKYFDKENDCAYTMSFMNFNEYLLTNFAMAKIIEMTPTEQNQVALYLFNSIKLVQTNLTLHKLIFY